MITYLNSIEFSTKVLVGLISEDEDQIEDLKKQIEEYKQEAKDWFDKSVPGKTM